MRQIRTTDLSKLLLVILCAAVTFGGTFECKSSSHSDDDDFVEVGDKAAEE